MTNPNTPVIVGVAQVLNRIQNLDEAIEPLQMMLQAVRLAEQDTGVGGLLRHVQSVRVIRGMWNYVNPASYIAEQIGAPQAQTVGTLFGGNQNQAVVSRTAVSILSGELDLALITGAENGNSTAKARKAGAKIPLTETPGTYDLVIGSQKINSATSCIFARGISTLAWLVSELVAGWQASHLRRSIARSPFAGVHDLEQWRRGHADCHGILPGLAVAGRLELPYS